MMDVLVTLVLEIGDNGLCVFFVDEGGSEFEVGMCVLEHDPDAARWDAHGGATVVIDVWV
jgi:hypothetical protein